MALLSRDNLEWLLKAIQDAVAAGVREALTDLQLRPQPSQQRDEEEEEEEEGNRLSSQRRMVVEAEDYQSFNITPSNNNNNNSSSSSSGNNNNNNNNNTNGSLRSAAPGGLVRVAPPPLLPRVQIEDVGGSDDASMSLSSPSLPLTRRSHQNFFTTSGRRAAPRRLRVLDIVCLMPSANNWIAIPRGDTRKLLSEHGLVQKLRITSDASESMVREAISSLFRHCFGLDEDELLPFDYLRTMRTGKRLIRAQVPDDFEWKGQEVVNLAGQGCLYIMSRIPYVTDTKAPLRSIMRRMKKQQQMSPVSPSVSMDQHMNSMALNSSPDHNTMNSAEPHSVMNSGVPHSSINTASSPTLHSPHPHIAVNSTVTGSSAHRNTCRLLLSVPAITQSTSAVSQNNPIYSQSNSTFSQNSAMPTPTTVLQSPSVVMQSNTIVPLNSSMHSPVSSHSMNAAATLPHQSTVVSQSPSESNSSNLWHGGSVIEHGSSVHPRPSYYNSSSASSEQNFIQTHANASRASFYPASTNVVQTSQSSPTYTQNASTLLQKDSSTSLLPKQQNSTVLLQNVHPLTQDPSPEPLPHRIARARTRVCAKDIICLLPTCVTSIPIPRRDTRRILAEKGLVQKIRIATYWSEEQTRQEISKLFRQPFGLQQTEILPYDYLCTKPNCKRLVRASGSDGIRWGGQEVVRLAGQGSLYIVSRIPLYTNTMISWTKNSQES